MEIKSLKIIEIVWDGPYKVRDNTGKKKIDFETKTTKEIRSKKGIYQIYGIAPTSSQESLLYIGKTKNFSNRMGEHNKDWIRYEPSEIKIYFGYINEEIEEKEYDSQLSMVEKLLIYYCTPQYNSDLLVDLRDIKSKGGNHTIILNLFRRNLLPYELSTLWYYPEVWEEETEKRKPRIYDLNFISSPS